MTVDRDPRLQALFSEARQDLDGEAFTARVMAKTRFLKYRLPAVLIGIALLLTVCALLLAPSLQEFALLVALGLTTSLVDLGDGWLAWVLSPMNTVGSLVILCTKAIRMGQKRIMGLSRA